MQLALVGSAAEEQVMLDLRRCNPPPVHTACARESFMVGGHSISANAMRDEEVDQSQALSCAPVAEADETTCSYCLLM